MKTCEYCGNNPVPHLTNWYFESLNVLLTPVRQKVLYNPVSEKLQNVIYPWGLGLKFTKLLMSLGAVKARENIHDCKVGRAEVLWDEALKRGIKMKELLLFGNPFDTYLAEKNGKTLVFSGLPRVRGNSGAAVDKMDDKLEMKERLAEAGLPVPQGGTAMTYFGVKRIFNKINKPVIIKPRQGSRGRHSTTHIYTEAQLKKAFKVAKQLCAWVIIEEHLEGPVYRGTVINYKTIGVLRGDAPQVVGDGTHTIRELVEEKNKIRHERVAEIKLDDRAEVFLKRSLPKMVSETFLYVPAAGQLVEISEKVGLSYGGSSSEDYSICHPDNLEMFQEGARVMGDPIVGFDFIIKDITKSYKEQKCGFIEANSLPFIDLHHHPLLGQPQNAAAAVWDMLGW